MDSGKNWDINVLKSIFNNLINVENIGKSYIPKFLGKDERVWHYSKNGKLATKSAYRLIFDGNEVNPNSLVN